MEQQNSRKLILKTLEEKACLKQKIHENTRQVFNQFKECLNEVAQDIDTKMSKVDDCIIIDYKDKGEFEAEIRFADDSLIFFMHPDIFDFDKSHLIWKSSYVNEDNHRSYCGMINVYNFLTNSFNYNRDNDIGYLIARIFINRDLHFFVEGKRQLSFLYNDFVHSAIDKKSIVSIIESAILYCLEFDLLTPPYDHVQEVRVSEMKELSSKTSLKTGKRLGFRFHADDDKMD